MSTTTYPEDAAFARAATYSPLGSGIIEAQNGLTAREHAAIALRVPESGNEWLDKMIRTAQRNDLAAKAITADMAGDGLPLRPADQAKLVQHAYAFADAMLSGAATQKGE